MNFVTQSASNPAEVQSVERVVLTGFMGSGKTTVGAKLAERLGWRFLDLDHEIERRAGMSVPQIFAEQGEPEFRRQESLALLALLAKSQTVIALGGGAPEFPANRLALERAERTVIVHLTAPFPLLVERCHTQVNATERPVLANLETAQQRFAARHEIYAAVSHHTVDTASISQIEAVDAIAQLLHVSRV